MNEDEDKFYDSLDDMPEYHRSSNKEGSTSCLFMSDVIEVQSCFNNIADDDDVSSLIPLYGGEVQKDVSCRKLNRRKIKRTSKCLELLDGKNKKQQQNSYVTLFRSRIVYPSDRCNKKVTDSVRALDGDSTHRTINDEARPLEVFEDAQDVAADDTASFYENILKKSPIDPSINNAVSSNTMQSATSTSLANSSVMEMQSVSEQVLHSVSSVKSRRHSKKKVSPSEPVITGRLGPDIIAMKEKLENWKRRQSYGLTASQKNRIKIKESKLLKELKAEATKEQKASSE